jgi:acyl carrier protein
MKSKVEILEELTFILRDLLADESVSLQMNTVRSDIKNWDSFNYIAFMVAVEAHCKVKFKTSDIEEFPDVGAIVNKIVELKA